MITLSSEVPVPGDEEGPFRRSKHYKETGWQTGGFQRRTQSARRDPGHADSPAG